MSAKRTPRSCAVKPGHLKKFDYKSFLSKREKKRQREGEGEREGEREERKGQKIREKC